MKRHDMRADEQNLATRQSGTQSSPAQPERGVATGVACPFCSSRDVELISLFGGQLSTDQYYCRACRTYFERFGRDEEESAV
jgi:hypothetical protein